MEALKRKKPPACDFCKAKRVICHPHADGCPRCVEKGLVCVTSPPVPRKKPQRRKVAGSTAPPPPPTASTSTLPSPTPLATTTSSTNDSSRSLPYPLPNPEDWILPSFSTAAPSNSSLVPQFSPPSQLQLNTLQFPPDLARHLFYCFEQCALSGHPIFQHLPLLPIFEAVSWHIDLLPLPQRALAYCVCAVGSLFSFDRAIIGPEDPQPRSFKDFDEVPPEQRDFRDFGRRRAVRCAEIRERVENLAKEADVIFVSNLENATSCLLLDTVCTGSSGPSRPWITAFMAHVRDLAETGPLVTRQRYVWLLYHCVDVFAEINSGRLTASYMDELELTGEEQFNLTHLDQQYQDHLARASGNTDWPDISPIPTIYLRLARKLTEKLTGSYARRQPLNEVVLSSFFSDLEHMRSISSSVCAILEGLLASLPSPSTLFPLASPPPPNDPLAAALAPLQGFYLLATGAFTTLVLPLFRELKRRRIVLESDVLRRTAAGRSTTFAERLAKDRLVVAEQHLREYFLVAVKASDRLLQQIPALAVSATMRQDVGVEWVAMLLEEVTRGEFAVDEEWVEILTRTAASLKIGGFIHSSPYIDGLIERLEHCVSIFTRTQPSAAHFALPQDPPLSLTSHQHFPPHAENITSSILLDPDRRFSSLPSSAAASPPSCLDDPSAFTTSQLDSLANSFVVVDRASSPLPDLSIDAGFFDLAFPPSDLANPPPAFVNI